MKLICELAALCAAILLVSAIPARGQSKPENLFTPPNWIWGEWSSMVGADADNIERIVFSSNEIELTQGLADTLDRLSRKFKKYQVKETVEPEMYRVVISKDKDEIIYEFKLCPKEECSLNRSDALTYSIKNKKTIRTHSTSIDKVLIRRWTR